MRGPAAAALLSVVVIAAPAARAERHLHERVDDPRRGEGPLLDQPAEGENPAALRVAGREVPEPDHVDVLGQGELPMEAQTRDHRFRPDLATDAFPEHLSYTSVFQPSVAPFKRQSVLDAVGPRYELTVRRPALSPVPIGGRARPGREVFWGSLAVRLSPGRAVPIPSVAPGARILSVRARPERSVSFSRDSADNSYVTGQEAGLVRLVFVTDAPASYFGGPLPVDVLPSDVPTALRPILPPRVEVAASHVAAELGLEPSAPVARNLARLVHYLRSFRPEPLGETSGDPYVALALGRRGVCRHRAFVFVVTAQHLGLPARLVTNEAHAFAEVWLPSLGWRRVDLGGAGPDAAPSPGELRHQPPRGDPFSWPSGHSSSSTPTGGTGGAGTRAGAQPPRADHTAPLAEQLLATRPGREGEAQARGDQGPASASTEAPSTEPGQSAEAPPTGRVVISAHSGQVLRGEALVVAGRVEARHGVASGARVRLVLRRADGLDVVELGVTFADESGQFRAHMAVPPDLPAGDYALGATID